MKILALALTLVPLLAGTAQKRFVPLYIHDTRFVAEIAETMDQQVKGLMFRRSIPRTYGMLFIYQEEDIRGFWMKNTWIPLDLIFLNRNRQVVDMFVNVPPCSADPCPSYVSKVPAQYVLEIRGDLSRELKLKEGDTIFFSID
jgi:uncharacterized membrane protein (UPF0127 family)